MTGVRIFDTFLFDGELALLAHRFAETADLIDVYVIIEAGETFSGKPKPMIFEQNRERFRAYEPKICRIALSRLGNSATNPWDRERNQREALHFALDDANPRDVILILDADEIPSRSLLQRLRRDGLDIPRRLLMTRHYEAVDLLGPRSPCCIDRHAPFACAHRRLMPGSWGELDIDWFSRSGVATPYHALMRQDTGTTARNSAHSTRRNTPAAGALPDAGRHLCFVDPSAHPQRKLSRIAHTELANERGLSLTHLSRCRANAVHHLGWWYAERPQGLLPEDLRRLLARDADVADAPAARSILLRRALRSWAWLRRWNRIPEAIVRIIDNRFEALLPGLLCPLLGLDLCRAIAAYLGRAHAHPRLPGSGDSFN
jgi:beta-1,4-mannosyl-glycoprotein beta-1,4-N-acetylglucosaminyltransferase